jgi:hypothetical protein
MRSHRDRAIEGEDMRTWLIALTLTLAAPLAAGAACLGDFNLDGRVEINEIIVSVNNALNGCADTGPTPTPTTNGCPIDFSTDNTADTTPTCHYVGTWNPSCGANDLASHWVSDGQFVVVTFEGFDPPLFYGAEVISPTSAALIGWFRQADASDLTESSGAVGLGPNGSTLVLAPSASPFSIESCDFTRYDATLTEVNPGMPAVRAAAPAGRLAALARLRAAAVRRDAPATQLDRVGGAAPGARN